MNGIASPFDALNPPVREWRMINAAYPMLGNQSNSTSSFEAVFGVNALVAWRVFEELFPNVNSEKGFETFAEKHLLWGLYFLKCYPTDRVGAVFVRSSVKTFKKWSKHSINHVAALFHKKVRSACVLK